MLFLHLALLGSLLTAKGQDFMISRGDIPSSFSVSDRYPDRSEDEECRPIQQRFSRTSLRYQRDLVSNFNFDIEFVDDDARRMTSRLQIAVDTLAASYRNQYSNKLKVLLAWADFEITSLFEELGNTSLHYEGRSVRVQGYGVESMSLLERLEHHSQLLILALQAGFTWVSFEAEFYVKLSVVPDLCNINTDLVWLLDQSGSVGSANHDLALQFIENVVNRFDIAPNNTRVAMISYSTEARLEFDFTAAPYLRDVRNKIDNIPFRGGWTATTLALNGARYILNEANGFGVRPQSNGVPRVVVLITDGRSNLYALGDHPERLREEGAIVYTVGVGNIYLNELLYIASDPDVDHVFLLRSYRDADTFVDFLGASLCESPAIVITGGFVVTTILREELRYFQSVCGRFTVNSTIIVEVIDTIGFSFVYVSTRIRNPGPVSPRPYIVANENAAFKRQRRLIRISFTFEQHTTVYVTMEGQEDTNEFSMRIWEDLFKVDEIPYTILGGTQPANPIVVVSDYLLDTVTGSFKYTLTEGNEAGRFSIDSGSGAVSVNAPLNPSDALEYNLTVVAESTEDECQRSRVYVIVQVTPPNTAPPTFTPLTPVSVLENAPNGQLVVTVAATDSDIGRSGEVRYSIVGGDMANVFSIDEVSGEVRVSDNTNLNRSVSMIVQYNLGIQATDLGETPRSSMATQVINVDDVNEAPFFIVACALDNSCESELSEGSPSNTPIRVLTADDVDIGTNGIISYSLVSTNPMELLTQFGVDSGSGQLRLTGEVDFETVQVIIVTVAASDGGNPSLSVSTEVTVTVTDVNDNNPTIIADSPISVSELAEVGSTVTVVAASDPDQGMGGRVTFSFSSPSTVFGLNGDNIVLLTELDYETVDQYTITLVATDGGGLTSSKDIVFNVLNENDNSPIFDPTSVAYSIVENGNPPETLGVVMATDADRGSFGVVRYRIQAQSDPPPFAVNATSGEVTTTSSLDREAMASHQFVIEAYDGGIPAMIGLLTVTVTVTDDNDWSPEFVDDYVKCVREDAAPQELLVVMATDRDEAGTPNSEVEYFISSGNDDSLFSLNRTSGSFRLEGELDYETATGHNVTVEARDMGQDPLSGFTVVQICVTDVPDNAPNLTSNRTVNVSESTAINTVITTFIPSGVDTSSQLMYSISLGNEEGLFDISDTGDVTLVAMLDYENEIRYDLRITVEDNMMQSSSVFLFVNVVNENDETPKLTAPSTVSIEEEGAVNSLVFQVNATDDDIGVFGLISYSLIVAALPGGGLPFKIDSNGTVTIATRIDRDVLPVNGRTLQVEVIARDGGNPSLMDRAVVPVEILDINDNMPEFSASEYTSPIAEGNANRTLLTVTASDRDDGTNAEITFSLSVTDPVPFQIDSVSGVISTTGELDRETRDEYELTVVAADNAVENPMSSTAIVTVAVTDINDNVPQLGGNLFNVSIIENVPPTEQVIQLSAMDDDLGANGMVSFRIESGNRGEPFEINNQTGEVTRVKALDFEDISSYQITIVAFDGGNPPLSSVATLRVAVINIDESPPRFQLPCEVTLDEVDVTPPDLLRLLSCIAIDYDDDRPTGFPVTYNLVSVNGFTSELDHPFQYEQSTGELIARDDLDFEADVEWRVRVSAADPTGNTAEAEILVTLRDINDNAPIFIDGPYDAIYTNLQTSRIYIFNSEDLDRGINGLYDMEIVGAERSGDSVVVTINATDFGNPSLTGSTTVTVDISQLLPCSLVDFTLEYTRGGDESTLFASALCDFSQAPQDVSIVLGGSHTFQCAARGSADLTITYRWLHNGSFITESSANGSLTLTNIQFSDAGSYACRATNALGTIQASPPAFVGVLVAPTILVSPGDVSTERETMATFTCVVSGQPAPTIRWVVTRETLSEDVVSDERIFVQEGTLIITDVRPSDQGDYSCVASNAAGSARSTGGRLIIFGSSQIAQLTIEEIRSPDAQSSCQEFNVQDFADALTEATESSLQMYVTDTSGENLCLPSACSPNPCQNGGECGEVSDNADGYMCNCTVGWTGSVCQEDVDECVTNPCLFMGNCTNTNGSFTCSCVEEYTGPTCSYNATVCSSNPCTAGLTCVETVTRVERYICVNTSESVIAMTTSGDTTSSDLDTVVAQETLVDPIPFATETSVGRRRRQVQSDLRCEYRFVALSSDQFAVVVPCPVGAATPSKAVIQEICLDLIRRGWITRCSFSDGTEVTVPPPVDLPAAKINLRFVITRGDSYIPLDSEEAVEQLENSGALEALRNQGYGVLQPEPVGGTVQPTIVATEPTTGGLSVGAITGIVFGALFLVLILVLLIGLVICFCACCTGEKAVLVDSQGRERTVSMFARPMSVVLRSRLNTTAAPPRDSHVDVEYRNPTFANDWANNIEASTEEPSLQERFDESRKNIPEEDSSTPAIRKVPLDKKTKKIESVPQDKKSH